MARKRYILTARAGADLREARVWSRARWGKPLTNRYFEDLHKAAQHIAENHAALRGQYELAGGTSLLLYPVREHYIVYEPLNDRAIAVVALIRQGRDVPAILQKWAAPVRRELEEIRGRIDRNEIAVPKDRAITVRRNKRSASRRPRARQ